MIRAVVDTNVLVSGLLSPSGKEALVILAMHRGLVRPCLSPPILEEYAEVLLRPKFAFPPEDIEALLAMLNGKGELVAPSTSPVSSPHADDTKFLACAFAARAEVLVTGNKRHFPEGTYGTTRVVNAGELLERIALEL